jgi:hypothetical protein
MSETIRFETADGKTKKVLTVHEYETGDDNKILCFSADSDDGNELIHYNLRSVSAKTDPNIFTLGLKDAITAGLGGGHGAIAGANDPDALRNGRKSARQAAAVSRGGRGALFGFLLGKMARYVIDHVKSYDKDEKFYYVDDDGVPRFKGPVRADS